jgi:heme oxygenase
MLAHLAQQTRPHQVGADADRLAILERERVTDDHYRTYLAKIYCFEAPFEAALIATDGVDAAFVRRFARSHWLAADLEALSIAARPLGRIEPIRYESAADALGWMYIVHRNTLVHGLVLRYLARKLPEPIRIASAYLASTEGCAGAMLRELGSRLDATARRASIAERIVAAADDALRLQRQWYSCDLLTPRPAIAPTPRRAA